MDTPASVANRIEERPCAIDSQLPGSVQAKVRVTPMWATIIPSTARPRAASRATMREPGGAVAAAGAAATVVVIPAWCRNDH
ncbi:hypothetical protein Ntsu_21400 [Nocardia sp. IFM 10818]